MSCSAARVALGAYVLGSLSPAERSAVDAHLSGCPACREELALLAGLPGLLGRLTERDVVAGPVRPQPGLLERLLAEVALRRRRARRRRIVLAAAAVVLALGIGGTAASLRGEAPRPRMITVEGAPIGAPAVHASFGVLGRPWGTEVTLRLRGVAPGERCRLVALARDGRTEVAGSWRASYRDGITVTGATSIDPADLRSLRVVTFAGQELVAAAVAP